jgi:glycosyltransferase involved in cell wall biosynthesis
VAVCIGRVTRQKGQDVLLSAWPDVLARHQDAVLAIVGHGDLRASLRQQAPPSVWFHDPVSDVWPWYAAADVVVLPSRWEGLSLTLLEAMASSRPVVASDIAGIAEATVAGAGALVPPEDPAALAQAISHRFDDPVQARIEGLVGARYAAAEADVRRTLDRLADITDLVATGGSSEDFGVDPPGSRICGAFPYSVRAIIGDRLVGNVVGAHPRVHVTDVLRVVSIIE